jgi:hypothetical protein
MAAHQVRALLMGGQACVFYGAAEFSRDTDFAILAEPENLRRLAAAMQELQAECIAVPPFAPEFLERGHAVHFRCQHPEAADMRVDVMSRMRGVEPFPVLWERRTTLADETGVHYDLLSLPDLVRAKKTQRSKDWPMIRRLLEASYLRAAPEPMAEEIAFWLMELRTPRLLVEAVGRWPKDVPKHRHLRPLLAAAELEKLDELESALLAEELAERALDRAHWGPLKAELEQLRHAAPRGTTP